MRITYGQWSPLEKIAYLVLLSAAFGLVWLLLGRGRKGEQAFDRQPCLLLVAIGAAVVLPLSGVLSYGQYCGAVAAAVTGTAGGLLLWCHWLRQCSNSLRTDWVSSCCYGAAGVLTFSLGSLIVLGYFFASLTITNAVLLFVSLAAGGTVFPRDGPPPGVAAVGHSCHVLHRAARNCNRERSVRARSYGLEQAGSLP